VNINTETVTRLMNTIGTEGFALQLHRYITDVIRFDFLSIDAQRADTGLEVICRFALSSVDYQGITSKYQELGLYRDDPARDIKKNGIKIDQNTWYLHTDQKQLANSPKHLDLYRRFNIRDRINLGQPMYNDTWISVKLIRLEHFGEIAPHEELNIRKLAPFLCTLCANHFRLMHCGFTDKRANQARLKALTEKLSKRELEVLSYNLAGDSNKSAAERMDISVNTAIALRQRAYRKLSVHNMAQLQQKLAAPSV